MQGRIANVQYTKYLKLLENFNRDADASPESLHWNSGHQLEWLRLKKVAAFDYDWRPVNILIICFLI